MSEKKKKKRSRESEKARWKRARAERRNRHAQKKGEVLEGEGSKERSLKRISQISQDKTVNDKRLVIKEKKRLLAEKKARAKRSEEGKSVKPAAPKRKKKNAPKRIKYKGFVMDSSSEFAFAKMLDEHGITWVKNSTKKFPYKTKSGRMKNYVPDFYLPDYDEWVEIKGPYYQSPDIREKLAAVGDNIELIYSDELRLPECCAHLRKPEE